MHRRITPYRRDVLEAISSFLAAPPPGTPTEVIEAFGIPREADFLPPQLFLETVEQAPVAISITDPTARILYVNAAFETLTGYHREEVLGKNESVLSSPATPLSVYQELWEVIQEQRVWRGTLINHRRDGREYLAELIISPVLTAEGRIAYYLGMHRDVSELHQLEQRLKFQNSLTETVLDAAPVVIALVGAEREVLLDNQAYKTLRGDFRGTEPAELFLDALQQQLDFDLENSCGIGEIFSDREVRLDRPGGRAPRWFTCSAVRVRELDEAARNYFRCPEMPRCCLLLIAKEITVSRNRLNRAKLSMIRANMAEQQMVQSMREAISAAAFKLQAPLNLVRAALAMPDTQNGHCGLRTVLRQALESGDSAIESLQESLPNQTLEQRSPMNVNEILQEVLDLSTDRLLASGVVVDWRPAPLLPTLTGRVNALRGLFKYLVDNAVQALNESDRNERELRIGTRTEGRDLMIEIIDNGPGVPEIYRIKAFEPFFCGWSQPGEHAGMGLTLAQEVALNHGGSVEIDADFLGGCRVFVRLPVHGMVEG